MDSPVKPRPFLGGFLLNTAELVFDKRNLSKPDERPHSAPEKESTADDASLLIRASNLEHDFYKYHMRDRRDRLLDGLSNNSFFSPGPDRAQMSHKPGGSNFMLEKVSKLPPDPPSIEERKIDDDAPEDSMEPLPESGFHVPLNLAAMPHLAMATNPQQAGLQAQTVWWTSPSLPPTDVANSSPELAGIRVPVTYPKKKNPNH